MNHTSQRRQQAEEFTRQLCPTCHAESQAGTRPPLRYCAPARCYCLHPECHAYPNGILQRELRQQRKGGS